MRSKSLCLLNTHFYTVKRILGCMAASVLTSSQIYEEEYKIHSVYKRVKIYFYSEEARFPGGLRMGLRVAVKLGASAA